jgi:cellobiose phosphorylase
MKTNKNPLSNPYGYFDQEGMEYVITRPDTPTPWMNYLGEGRYGGIISNAAGGFAFDRDPKNRRVTRYRYNSIPIDQPGRYVFLRDMQTGAAWSPTWGPMTQVKLNKYECRHGAGYTRIASEKNGVAASVLYFVPRTEPTETCPVELWVLTVRNNSKKARKLRSFSYVEFSFRDTMGDQLNLDWCQHILESRYKDGIITSSTRFSPTTNFFASNVTPAGFHTDRETFIGKWRDLSNPQVVETGKPDNVEAPRGNNIGSLCHDISLKPGEEKQIVFMMGVTDEPARIAKVVRKYQKMTAVADAFGDLCADWEDYLSRFVVETPDPVVNAMLNVWNPIQCRTTLFWSRFVSAYETGTGRGMGTRDSAQDTLGTVHNAPDRARTTLNMLWHLQYKDGHTWHQVLPLTGEGGPGLAAEFPKWPQWFCDDHLWLVIAVCAYVRETGDVGYLEEKVAYWDGEEATIWEHMMRAVEFTVEHRGPHGLPRMGFSDWDDTLNADHGSGKAESVWCAQQFCKAVLDMAELCEFLARPEEAKQFRTMHLEMSKILNDVAWDGAWYARAFDDEGKPIGVKSEEHHKLALNTQTWAVIGETAPPDRAKKAMDSIHKKLNCEYGLALMWPAYTKGDDRVRGTTTYPPGAKENGGIFCHANTWAIVAAAKAGLADRAMQYYLQITPFMRTDHDVMKVEPYVYCGNITGPEHKQYGYARNAWLSGTASWTYVAGTQWILGIRPTYEGLLVDPVIPKEWPGFKASRVFRGVRYQIQVRRAQKNETPGLIVDGTAVAGKVIPLPAQQVDEVAVEVIIA